MRMISIQEMKLIGGGGFATDDEYTIAEDWGGDSGGDFGGDSEGDYSDSSAYADDSFSVKRTIAEIQGWIYNTFPSTKQNLRDKYTFKGPGIGGIRG